MCREQKTGMFRPKLDTNIIVLPQGLEIFAEELQKYQRNSVFYILQGSCTYELTLFVTACTGPAHIPAMQRRWTWNLTSS